MARTAAFERNSTLQQAMDVFWKKGFNGTSMQDLVDATGLNRSSIYNTFGSKLELYQETLEHYQKESRGVFQKALVKAKDPLEAIRFIFEGFLPEIMDDSDGKGCFGMNCKSEMGNQDDGVKQWLLTSQDGLLQLFKNLIIDGQQQGVINTHKDAEAYTYHVFNSFQGFRMTGMLIRDRKALKSIIDSMLEILA